jgi:peptidoglycan L-alanyl-D-glutamate endopeptidase CwlK
MSELSQRSLDRLDGVHPDLVKVVRRAVEITTVDFGVSEGLRSIDRQKKLVAAGASTTMNSRHLTGHAVDLVAYVDGDVRWDRPLYARIAKAMKDAATELHISIVWGGDWISFKGGPHFELNRKVYPT